MTRRGFVAACCVLLFAISASAQSGGAKADPVSGTWKGELNVPMAPDPVAVTFELKFDGKSKVSGTFTGLPSPGDVKIGTFDPKTGALKLQLGKTDDSAVLIILEGTLDKGVAPARPQAKAETGRSRSRESSAAQAFEVRAPRGVAAIAGLTIERLRAIRVFRQAAQSVLVHQAQVAAAVGVAAVASLPIERDGTRFVFREAAASFVIHHP